jgi:adenylosuccinate lyase
MESITALSVLDGRYKRSTAELRDIFSEFGLMKYRVKVEVEWLRFVLGGIKLAGNVWTDRMADILDNIESRFDVESAARIKDIEKTTNHDVKAVEYYIKEKLAGTSMASLSEWTHFACTSDDINNTAYALMVKDGRKLIIRDLDALIEKMEKIAFAAKGVPMMSRTHGQPATPTTAGKELVNFTWRLREARWNLAGISVQGKMNGATGNFNAHAFAFPDVDWINASRHFIENYLEIEPVLYTTQINPNGYLSRILHSMIRIASIITDLDRDMWGYISLGYFRQKVRDGEIGSSTMPHKVNPIDFENSEGNLGVAISLMEHMSVKLLNSRFQRDLTDSTVLRNLGAVFGYLMIGMKSTLRGFDKVELDEAALRKDLEENLELLAEPVQTLMRVCGENNPYEKMKALTRGRKITRDDLNAFIDSLEKPGTEEKARMKALTPSTYIGLAEQLVDEYFEEIKQ